MFLRAVNSFRAQQLLLAYYIRVGVGVVLKAEDQELGLLVFINKIQIQVHASRSYILLAMVIETVHWDSSFSNPTNFINKCVNSKWKTLDNSRLLELF